jgi:hypothetical protein
VEHARHDRRQAAVVFDQVRSNNGRACCRARKLNDWIVQFMKVDISPNLPPRSS